jgi:hypothetical protein
MTPLGATWVARDTAATSRIQFAAKMPATMKPSVPESPKSKMSAITVEMLSSQPASTNARKMSSPSITAWPTATSGLLGDGFPSPCSTKITSRPGVKPLAVPVNVFVADLYACGSVVLDVSALDVADATFLGFLLGVRTPGRRSVRVVGNRAHLKRLLEATVLGGLFC